MKLELLKKIRDEAPPLGVSLAQLVKELGPMTTRDPLYPVRLHLQEAAHNATLAGLAAAELLK